MAVRQRLNAQVHINMLLDGFHPRIPVAAGRSRNNPRVRRWFATLPLLAALLATGAAGLIYQVAWQRYLARIAGSDTLAIAVTLAVFLSGLSLGYALCGGWAAQTKRPVLIYSALEAGIGVWGLLFPVWFARVDGWAVHWPMTSSWGLLGGGVAAAMLLILPPTLLMGATVPFITQAAAGDGSRLTGIHALVYGVNTAGAMAGALGAAFWLLPALGLPGAVRGAALLNFAGAAVFALAAWRVRSGALELAGAQASAGDAPVPYSPGRLHAIAFITGAAGMILENTLMRFFALSAGGTAFIFAMIVAVFIAAIAAGSLGVARARRISAGALTAALSASAILLMLLYALLDDGPYATHLLRIAFASSPPAFWVYHAALLVALLLLVGLPAALIGAVLPLLFHALRPGARDAGRTSGRLLAWNALGCLAGSLGGGFLLFHWLDLARIYLLAPVLLSAGAWLVLPPASGLRRIPVALTGLAALLLFALRPGCDPARFAWGAYRTREPLPFSFAGPAAFQRERMASSRLLATRDGPLASVAVMETTLPAQFAQSAGVPQGTGRALFVNGKSESNTLYDRETVRLSAHLPALLSGHRRRALVVGLGTGVTAGELTLYPELRRIDVAEISPEVIAALPWFKSANRDVAADPRVRILQSDALLVLRRPGEKWDLISSEPSNPWVPGVDQLFTRDFYAQVKSRLDDDGVFLQWFHLYESSPELTAMIAATLHSEFPELRAFRGNRNDVLVVAAARPIPEARWREAELLVAGNAGLRDSLAEFGSKTAAALQEREIPGFAEFARKSAAAGVNTLDHPRLHDLAGRAFFAGRIVEEEKISSLPPPGQVLGGLFKSMWDPGSKSPGEDFARALIEQAAKAREKAGLPGNRPWSTPAASAPASAAAPQ